MSHRTSWETWRRPRTKSILSRRSSIRQRSTSAEDDDLGEEDEILSCFLDDEPVDNGFLVDRVVQDSLTASQANVLHADQKRNEEGPSPDALAYEHDFSNNSELVQLRPKTINRSEDRSRSRSSSQKISESDAGDAPRASEFDRNHVATGPNDSRPRTDIDFTDMASSRAPNDVPDIGLDRPEFWKHRMERPRSRSRSRSTLEDGSVHHKPKTFKPTIQFGCFDIVIGILAISIFFVDIGTDIELAAHYFRLQMWMYGGVTFGLIVWPSIITTILGLHWYIIDYNKEKDVVEKIKKAKKKAFITPRYVWLFRFLFTILQLGPVLRISAYLYYGHMSKNKKLTEKQRNRYYHFMLYEDVDSCLLRLFESFLESAPQLAWQLYIAMVLKPKEDVVGTSFRAIALLSSWGSLAISLVSYHRSLRNSNDEKAKMKWSSVPFYFIWRASETGGRILCIATFASAFHLWVFGPVLFHWLFMSAWLMAQKTSFYKNACQEKTFNIICGYVMIFCFLNLREGVTRFRFLLFYFIMYLENFVMLGFWYQFSPDLGEWFHLWGFIAIIILFFFHIISQLLYYCLFHPTNDIKICSHCDANTIYESVCYDLDSSNIEPESPQQESLVIPVITVDPAERYVRGSTVEHVSTV